VRPGLVVVGVLFLVLASGTAISVYAVQWPQPMVQVVSPIVLTVGPGFPPAPVSIPGVSSSSGSFSVVWSSTVAVDVQILPPSGCSQIPPTNCPPPPMHSWTSSESGNWTVNGAVSYPVTLEVAAAGATNGSFQARVIVTYSQPVSIPSLTLLFLDAAIGALAVVGCVALFLGFFLRGGVYSREPPPLVPPTDRIPDDEPNEPPSKGSAP